MIEVAEVLVHECMHEKFFDLAITPESVETSRRRARWPPDQTFTAWHAYSCSRQFFGDQVGRHPDPGLGGH
jgi:hypothetical protein